MGVWLHVRSNPLLSDLSLARLLDHPVEPQHRAWFARCKIHHTLAFPLASFDVARTLLIAMLCVPFAPYSLIGAFSFLGLGVAAAQGWFARSTEQHLDSDPQLLNQLGMIALVRSFSWTAAICGALLYAPADLAVPLAMLAVLMMLFDALLAIAIPVVGLACIVMTALGLATTLVMRGGMGNLLACVVVLLSAVAVHWALFNLHYMFATRRLRTRVLHDANETVQLLLNQYDEEGSDWLFECDVMGQIVNPTARFCRAAGRSAEELAGVRFTDLFDESPEREEVRDIGDRIEAFRDMVAPLTIAGSTHWWSVSARPIFDAAGAQTGWRGFVGDVTRTRAAEAQVTYMAHYDLLTNLPNRSLFNTTLQRAFARRGDNDLLAVLFVDLDHFKAVNDTHGHALGDQVLAEAARRIERVIPPRAMIARLGGDEFAVLLDSDIDRSGALAVANAIVTAMDAPVEIGDLMLPVGASVGIAFAPDNGDTGEDVLRAADVALYDAKAKGRRGASLFDPAMQEQVQARRLMELDLRAALTRGELQLHYQPLLDVQTGETVAYEALLRWQHGTRGMIEPSIFIPIAEETGLIVQIGEWVLREALAEAASWPDHLSVSVNLSPAQMRDDALLGTIINALATTGLDPGRLELEITETVLMHDSEENLALLHRIHELGVKIALDDFGTGYSSLNYLRSFPFDKIKIDRCFVTDLASKADSKAIVEAVIGLASQLNMRTTAEGVECESQLEQLRANGCDQVQGFLFSRAVPAANLAHRLAAPPNPLPKSGPAPGVMPVRKAKPAAVQPAKPTRQRKTG